MAKDNSGQFLNFSAKDKNTPKPKGTDNESNNNSVNVDVLTDKMGEMKVTSSPKFIVNTIMYVDGTESESSSDKEYTDSDKKMFAKLGDLTHKNNLPYRSSKVTKNGTKSIGFVKNQQVSIDVEDLEKDPPLSKYTQPFLDKLYSEGVEKNAQVKVSEIVSASILLNRPFSVSTRKNNLLKKELYSKKDDHPITHKKFGIFWQFTWYNKQNKEVSYSEVKTFYKKLKRYDKDKGTSKAEAFLETAEKGVNVPYQELRELAKNHKYTKKLIQKFRSASPDSDIYMSFIDADTVSFNGIYSAYLRIHSKSKISPTIMSTGYEFTEEQEGDHPFVEGSKLDRQVRIATAKHFPLGVYYPEPNFCVLIGPKQKYLEESFIDKTYKLKNTEAVALIRSILKSRDVNSLVVIFAEDNPLYTAIPPRARLTKTSKTPIKFSLEFKAGVGPTEKDFILFKQISQSHVHESVWLDNLYMNKGLKLDIGKGIHYKFKSLITQYLASDIKKLTELKSIIKGIIISCKSYTGGKILDFIEKAYEAKEKVIAKYKKENIRTPDMQALLDYMESLDLTASDFTNEFLTIVVSAEILDLLEGNLLDLMELNQLSSNSLKLLLYNDEVIDLIRKQKVSFTTMYNIYYEYFNSMKEDINEINLPEFVSLFNDCEKKLENMFFIAGISLTEIMDLYEQHSSVFYYISDEQACKFISEHDYDIEDIIELYEDNKELLEAMIEDPDNLVDEMGLEEFIEEFERAQHELEEVSFDDVNYGVYNAYDILKQRNIEENCPDEFLYGNSSDNSDD